jgi:serine/threonine protein kinase
MQRFVSGKLDISQQEMGNLTHDYTNNQVYTLEKIIMLPCSVEERRELIMIEHLSFDKLVGTTLGNYRLERLLEQNELGASFQAHNGTEKTSYLVRVLAPPTGMTPDARVLYLGRFQREANQVAELHNPYILPLLDYGNQQGMPYLVSPNLSTTSLSAQLSQKEPLDVLVASRYLDQIATALEYAHEHAVLHRNLNTDCILLKPDGMLVVTDFGVMRMLELSRAEQAGARSRPYGMTSSSAPAPEQILGKPVDSTIDVYALGAVLFRMLTGHRVFRGKNRDEIAQMHLHAVVPSVNQWRSGLPSGIDGVIARAMAKEPAQRYRQPGALANAYHEVVAPNDKERQPLILTAPVASPPQASPQPNVGPMQPSPVAQRNGQTPISRRRALTIIGAGGGAVAIVAVAAFASRYLIGNTSPSSTSTTIQSTPTTSQAATGNPPATQQATQATQPPTTTGRILAHTADIPLNSAKAIPNPNNPGSQNPVLLIHLINNQFVAYDSTCTHAGCAVNYSPQDKLLECPCHGAVFDPAKGAAVVSGPAPTPLTKINITVSNGLITEP